jgi:subtilisin family serine protease
MLDDGPASGREAPVRPLAQTGIEIAWQVKYVNAPQAWMMGFTGAGVLVAVVDTGLDYLHTDLANHIWVNEDEIPDNEEDDDENGFVDDVIGWDFVHEDNDPMGTGPGDHGTQVAGLVVGDGTAGTLTGVAPEATIMAIRGSGGSLVDLLEALQYAVDNGADVISMSVTQKWRFNPKPDYAAWRTVMDNELALGVVHVNSIGNEGDNFGTDPIPFNVAAPGNCPAPWIPGDQWLVGGVSGVIGVGAVDSLDNIVDGSSRGPSGWEDFGAHYPEYPYEMPPEYQDYPYTGGQMGLLKPDMAAPGPGTISTSFGGGYEEFSGTSASTPMVSAAVAILLQANPNLTPEEVTMILMTSARDAGPEGKDNAYGAGILDVEAAVLRVIELGNTSIIQGMVLNEALDPLPGATLELLENGLRTRSRSDGSYLFVTSAVNYTQVTDEFFNFADTASISPLPGPYQPPDVILSSRPEAALSGQVTDTVTVSPILGAGIQLPDTPVSPALTDTAGMYELEGLPAGRSVLVQAVHFGHHPDSTSLVLAEGENVIDFGLGYGIYDDFELDQGWTVGAPGDEATEGIWVREDPVATWAGAIMVQPEDDASPEPGTKAFITGNNYPAAGHNWNDVDGGRTTLISPVFDPTRYSNPMVEVRTWFSDNTGNNSDDVFTVEASSDSGMSWTTLEVFTGAHREWLVSQWLLRDFVDVTPAMRLRFIAEDALQESAVEAGVDEFLVLESTSSAGGNPFLAIRRLDLSAAPNPFNPRTVLSLSIPSDGRAVLWIVNVEGRRVRRLWDGHIQAGVHALPWDGRTDAGHPAASGFYFAKLSHGGRARTERLLVIK